MRLVYHPEAEAELIDAARFYEKRVTSLGSQFLDAVDIAAGEISEAPARFPVVKSDVRRYLLSRFPYGIYYRLHEDYVHILAIKHHSRHPEYWSHRFTE